MSIQGEYKHMSRAPLQEFRRVWFFSTETKKPTTLEKRRNTIYRSPS